MVCASEMMAPIDEQERGFAVILSNVSRLECAWGAGRLGESVGCVQQKCVMRR